MNLEVAQKELGSRGPRVTGRLLLIEILSVVAFSYLLVTLFS